MIKTNSSKALILIVHYREEVFPFLESLTRLRRSDEVEVCVIDNASGEPYAAGLHSLVPSVNGRFIESPENRGYTGAAKFALDQLAAEGRTLPEWVIVSNSDIVIQDHSFWEKLFALDFSRVGMIAPRIILPELGIDENPHMKNRPGWTSRLRMRVHSQNYFLCVAWDWLSRVKQALIARVTHVFASGNNPTEAGPSPIYAPHGSFMIFSRKYFEAGGYLDDEIFLNGEEIIVGEICQRLSLPVIYEPSLTVFHNEHQSVGIGVTRKKFLYHQHSTHHVLSKYLTPKPGS